VPKRFMNKPELFIAVQFTGDNVDEIWEVFGKAGIHGPTETHPGRLVLKTSNGYLAPAEVGDWIIPDSEPGTFSSCKPKVFEKKYYPFDEADAERRASPIHPMDG
jgi:hypothetical protein